MMVKELPESWGNFLGEGKGAGESRQLPGGAGVPGARKHGLELREW